jgi:hypothetical protein
MNNEYFFNNWKALDPWVRARGWGDNGNGLLLPRDIISVNEQEEGGTFYTLYHSKEQKRWYMIHCRETQAQWYGYLLYVDTEHGGSRIARSRKDAHESWKNCLEERQAWAKEMEYLDAQNTH